jgi:arginyl-tRNA synthetase
MPTLAQALTDLVRRAAEAAGHADAPVPHEPCVPTQNPQHGDYQSNFAFRLGKALRLNPRAVAERLRDALPPDPRVASVEVAGPGFLNFRLADDALATEIAARVIQPALGTPQPGAGRTVVIDFSSPNIAKRMHVGHIRSTVIGNALDRIHRFLGWNVVTDNHLGDWGTQYGKLIVAWRGWRDEAAYAKDPIGELQRLYQSFADHAQVDPGLLDRARAETVKLQEGDPENRRMWQQFVEVSMGEFDAIYARMGVRFDVTLGESYYRDQLGPLVERLLAEGLAVQSEGAVVIPLGEGELADKPLLIRKADGGFLYGTTDIATALHRVHVFGAERILYVVDTRQQLHFRQVFAACRKLGMNADFVHVWFGMLRLGDGQIAATRSGTGLNLLDVLDTAVVHARSVVDDKSAALPDDERTSIAEAVGLGAVVYTDLSQNPQSDVVFEWERMLSLDGNTAPYLMYAHARCHSIFRRAGKVLADHGADDIVLGHPTERDLALAILRFPEAVCEAAVTYRPNLLCDHLFGLANAFARFYRECRVLGDEIPAPTTRSRLSLTMATAQTLRHGLELLGMRPLERM